MNPITKPAIKHPLSFFLFLFSLFLILFSVLNVAIIEANEPIIINIDGVEIGQNKLSLGCQIDNLGVREFRDNLTRQQTVKDANLKLIRVFDWRAWEEISPDIDPSISWNDSTKTGVFNWTNIDNLVQAIFDIGAEPLFCLGAYSNSQKTCETYIPNGMGVDESLNLPYLPYAESFAAYCTEWVKHFEEVGLPVRYYEIWNEAFTVVFEEDNWGE